jgi:alkanesulfonate monooxygenase SsuD/methylene tetrahydromethanopterin reductase-like flavin-dependent oxidoreductase (luciferase family)
MLRLGLALGGANDAAGWTRLLEKAERAEALGLHSVWVPEMHFRPGAMASPLLALAAIAARTRRIRLGTTSLLLPIHHPLRIAEEVAALDALSGGRVELGLGRGFATAVLQTFGVEARDKRDRFDEALDAILAAWAAAGQDGPEPRPALRPVQRPHPPLCVAAFGNKGLLQAARRGLPYLASPLETLDVLCENHALHRAALPAGVEATALAVPIMRTVFVARDDARARAVREALAAESARLGRGLPPALARAAAGAVGERAIVGTASQVADLVARYRERLGMDLLIARGDVAGTTPEEEIESLERLAGEIVPPPGRGVLTG